MHPSSPTHAGVASTIPMGTSVAMPVRSFEEIPQSIPVQSATSVPSFNPFSIPVVDNAFAPPARVGHENHDHTFGMPRERVRERFETSTAEEDASLEDACFHWKEVTAIKFPPLPESAGP